MVCQTTGIDMELKAYVGEKASISKNFASPRVARLKLQVCSASGLRHALLALVRGSIGQCSIRVLDHGADSLTGQLRVDLVHLGHRACLHVAVL